MLFDLFQIYRARNSPPLAIKLAITMAHGQIFERLAAPIFIVQLLLWLVIVICTVIALGFAYLAIQFHWSAMFPLAIAGVLGGTALYISLGSKIGLDKVRELAASVSERGVDHVMDKLRQNPDIIPSAAATDEASR